MNRKFKCYCWTLALSALVIPLLFLFRSVPIAVAYSLVSVTIVGLSVWNYFSGSDSIPDKMTLSGVLLGAVTCALNPEIVGESTWKMGLYLSLGAAACAYWILWVLIELYRRFNNPRRVRFDEPVPFTWTNTDNAAVLDLDGDVLAWTDLFYREADKIRIEGEDVQINSAGLGSVELVFYVDRMIVGGHRYALEDVSKIEGRMTHLSLPFEPMGLGVVKAMTAFTALLGWQGGVFTFFGAIAIGAIAVIRITPSRTNSKLPFVPFLSISSIIWMIWGPRLLSMYMKFLFAK